MKISKEEKILKIIKFSPSIFVLIISIIVVMFLYFENKKTFDIQKKEVEEKYIEKNKSFVKEEVNRVYSYIKYLQENTEKELKNNVKSRVYEAHAIASSIFEQYKNVKTKAEIFELIKVALKDIRFNEGRGYFFMDDIHGNKLFHPVDTSIEGKNFLTYTDAKGYKLFETIVNTIKDKTERFDEYYWYKPNTNKEVGRKISFYKYFEPLNIAIGTGEYFDDFEKTIKAKALEYINLVKFGKAGYIFALQYDGTYLSHIKKEYIGKNHIENKEVKGAEKIFADMLYIANNKDDFYSYTQKKPYSDNLTKKISYVQGIKEWSWIIGSGFYEDDVNSEIAEIKKKLDEKYENYIKNILLIGFVLVISLLFISKYLSQYLENKLNQYKKELNKNQTILHQQSKMAAMGEMIGNIAHQWRQPLSTITTASSGMVLQKEMGILTDEFFYEASEKINKSAQYLSKTIDDFRNFFSPNKEKRKFSLQNTLNLTLDLISTQFREKEIVVIKNIEDFELFSYENELIQALINILNNSRDELIKKSSNEEKYIFIDVYKDSENEIYIVIKDNAGGINKEFIDKVFEPYFTTKHKSQGTGIGLYMTEEIISKHLNGRIFVKNKEFTYKDKDYVGAQFTIVLSLIDDD